MMNHSAEESREVNGLSKALNDRINPISLSTAATKAKAVDRTLTARQVLQTPKTPIDYISDKAKGIKVSPAEINGAIPLSPSSCNSIPVASDNATSTTWGKENLPEEEQPQDRLAMNHKVASNVERKSDSTDTSLPSDVEDFKETAASLSTNSVDQISTPNVNFRAISLSPPLGKSPTSNITGTNQCFLTPSFPPSPKQPSSVSPPLQIPDSQFNEYSSMEDYVPSPMPSSVPIPPLSLSTYLQLELSSNKPSPFLIHRSKMSDLPYESLGVKMERLQNFLILPLQLEGVLWFGALACLDAWLFTFTILPLRFMKALLILNQSWWRNAGNKLRLTFGHMYNGSRKGRKRRRESLLEKSVCRSSPRMDTSTNVSALNETPSPTLRHVSSVSKENSSTTQSHSGRSGKRRSSNVNKHRISKPMPSIFLPDHKADIIKGLLILTSCMILMRLDASRMYHNVRGQAAIKLYVIYNVLEVCDRLFSAIGQDVLECLFSKETLEWRSSGRSKIWRPLGLFLLALAYNLVHATSLFYQVITLNVAINSYSNALLTLLTSNQFVEIKSTVFKRIEKENLFQLTCADIVERFQLWLMLTIIASRNIIETGGLNLGLGLFGSNNGTDSSFTMSVKGSSILPKSFTMFPEWTGQFMGPFLLVLGSEMIVDWIKHAYITKFNNTKPAIYGRFLDVIAKDYYSNAFVSQNLVRRFGLPVIPLASLFIRASFQSYHTFLTTYMPLPIPSPAVSLSDDAETSSPAATAALQHIDHIFRRAFRRSSPTAAECSSSTWWKCWPSDDLIASATFILFFLLLYLVLLASKLILGMCLLSYARHRYRSMKHREFLSTTTEGKRVGGWGVVEVDEDTRRWIYQDDPGGATRMRERAAAESRKDPKMECYEGVKRYSMVAKRIW